MKSEAQEVVRCRYEKLAVLASEDGVAQSTILAGVLRIRVRLLGLEHSLAVAITKEATQLLEVAVGTPFLAHFHAYLPGGNWIGGQTALRAFMYYERKEEVGAWAVRLPVSLRDDPPINLTFDLDLLAEGWEAAFAKRCYYLGSEAIHAHIKLAAGRLNSTTAHRREVCYIKAALARAGLD
jgi:hypothetical protein